MNQYFKYVLFFAACFFTTGIGSACGDPTDDPEDCTANEYFDDGSELCRTCPALTPPECIDGCGFFIAPEDDRPCPEAICLVPEGDTCVCPSTHPECSTQTCAEGEVFDASSFECIDCDMSCDGTVEIANGTCSCSSS